MSVWAYDYMYCFIFTHSKKYFIHDLSIFKTIHNFKLFLSRHQIHQQSSPMSYSRSVASKIPKYKFQISITKFLTKTPEDTLFGWRTRQQVQGGSSTMSYLRLTTSKTPEYKIWMGIIYFLAKTPVDDMFRDRSGHQVHQGSSPTAYSYSATSKTPDYRFWIGLE